MNYKAHFYLNMRKIMVSCQAILLTKCYPQHRQEKNGQTKSLFFPYTFRCSLKVMSDFSCLVISSAAPRSHDGGVRQLCRAMRSPVPMLMGEKLMGVFSLLVPQGSLVLLEWGLATWATPNTSQHRPPRIKLPAWEKGLSNHFAYNAASDPPQAAGFAFVCALF